VSGPASPPQAGVSALGYPSGLVGPSEISVHSVEQVSSLSVATGIEEADDDTLSSSSLAAAPIAAAASIAAAARRRHRDGCRPRPYNILGDVNF